MQQTRLWDISLCLPSPPFLPGYYGTHPAHAPSCHGRTSSKIPNISLGSLFCPAVTGTTRISYLPWNGPSLENLTSWGLSLKTFRFIGRKESRPPEPRKKRRKSQSTSTKSF